MHGGLLRRGRRAWRRPWWPDERLSQQPAYQPYKSALSVAGLRKRFAARCGLAGSVRGLVAQDAQQVAQSPKWGSCQTLHTYTQTMFGRCALLMVVGSLGCTVQPGDA